MAEKSKVNLDLWNLFIAIVSLSLTYQVKLMTLAPTVYKKSFFQIFSQLIALYPYFTKDHFGPNSTLSIFLVDRPHICETIRNLRTITWEGLERSGTITSVLRESGTEKVIDYCFKTIKKSSRSKLVSLWSSWLSEGPLKVALSRLPPGAFVYPMELSSTFGSFRISSATLCRGSCEGCRKESIVTKYNSKIWFYIYSKSL